MTLTLGNGQTLVEAGRPGMSINLIGNTATVRMDEPGTAASGAGTSGIASSVISVTTIREDGSLQAESGVSVTRIGTAISVDVAEARPSDNVTAPGTRQRSTEFSIEEKTGRRTNFEASVADTALIVRPQTALGRELIRGQRNLVIALAMAEVQKTLNVTADQLQTVYLDLNLAAPK